MNVTISIHFLTGRAHLHPWHTHHSEGRVEWPPSHWRLLRALVAVAGRGLTTLPFPDEVPPPRPEPVAYVPDMAKPKERGVPPETRKKLRFSKVGQTLTLKEPLNNAEADAWKGANPGDAFATALDQLRALVATPDPVALDDVDTDKICLSHLASLLKALSTSPVIWLPKSSGGHTRQYFPIHHGGTVKNSGSAVFDTFAAVRSDQPLLFHWPELRLDNQQHVDLKLLLNRMTYFGRAESWCCAEVHTCPISELIAEGIGTIVPDKTHWECRCIEDHGKPTGQEYRDYLLERRLTPVLNLKEEVPGLLPRTKTNGKDRKEPEAKLLRGLLEGESPEKLLLRCLLRESGQDIKDGLERPIGTRWVHYAVPRAVYDVPRPKPQPCARMTESVDLVRYALNTATVGRAVLPAVTDTLLVADKFRSAVLAVYGEMFGKKKPSRGDRCREEDPLPRALCGHERDGKPCQGHNHASWWPTDDDNDGFIDHVIAWAPSGFEQRETDALRRLTRLRQRGGRPDLLVTPTYVGLADRFWMRRSETGGSHLFVSATPYFCPVHLSHGRGKSGRIRSLRAEVIKSLRIAGVIEHEDEIFDIQEIVFDYAPDELASVACSVEEERVAEPIPPRQYFPVIDAPDEYPPLPRSHIVPDARYRGAVLKDTDHGYCFGTSIGLLVNHGDRFIRALSFCRRRRGHELRGRGRMLQIAFSQPRSPRPFAIGDQCHFGLGLFVPAGDRDAK